MVKLNLEYLSFETLIECYLFLLRNQPENIEERTQYLNQAVNIGTFDEKGWVGVWIKYPCLKEFAIEVMQLHADNHHYETTYYEWMMLATFLSLDNPFRQKAVDTIKIIDKQW